jgi:hypothetical protein
MAGAQMKNFRTHRQLSDNPQSVPDQFDGPAAMVFQHGFEIEARAPPARPRSAPSFLDRFHQLFGAPNFGLLEPRVLDSDHCRVCGV